jgi:hypothetical protein
MIQTASRLLPKLPIFLMIAVATHLFMSFVQTLMHYGHALSIEIVREVIVLEDTPVPFFC